MTAGMRSIDPRARRGLRALLLALAVSGVYDSFADDISIERSRSGQAADAALPSIDAPGLSTTTFRLALQAYERAQQRGVVARPILSIIDCSLPSTAKRLWVLDLEHRALLFHQLVAHGRGTGENWAHSFSNRAGSQQSSLGAFRTGSAYRGSHGLSLKLQGLEHGINDLAEKRAIVLHGAPYVSESYAQLYGRIGRSLGCPAVPTTVADTLIQTIRDGPLLFAAFPGSACIGRSLDAAPPPGR